MKNLVSPRQVFVGLKACPADSHEAAAFTRLELLVVTFVLFLLGLIAIPVLASTKPRADRLTCANNLYLIGRACQMWANDHNDWVPWWVSPSDGGTLGHPLINNPWFNFATLSNELATASVLACPSDPKARVASDFSSNPDGGFLNPGYRNNAVSYFIGLHASGFFAERYFSYHEALAGDRNLRIHAQNVQCINGVTLASAIFPRPISAPPVAWTNAIHGTVGNILTIDGHVEQTSSERILDTMIPPEFQNPLDIHLLMPPR